MSRRRAGGRRGLRAGAAVLLVVVLLGSGIVLPGATGIALAQGTAGAPTTTAAAPLTPAEQRRADELRAVVRDALERDGDGDGLGDLDTGSIGGVLWRLAVVALAVVAVIVAIALVRRGPRARRRAAAAAATADDGAADLERQALRAEEAGEHRAAVVLWFRAGTRGLLERRRIRTAGAGTAGQVARAAGDERVAALAVAHDRAAYGPGPVDADASRGAREGWATVLRDEPAGGAPSTSADDTAGGGS